MSERSEKIKIFTAANSARGTFDHLEKEVNQWLQKKPGIEVVARQISTVVGQSVARGVEFHDDGEFMNLTIVIIYREPAVFPDG